MRKEKREKVKSTKWGSERTRGENEGKGVLRPHVELWH